MKRNCAFSRDKILTNRNLVIFFSLVAAVCLCVLLVPEKDEKNLTAVVRSDGEIIYTIDLGAVTEPYELDTGGNVLLVEKDCISVVRADCPDCLCVKQGAIRSRGHTIACLPHRLSVTLVGGNSDSASDALDSPDAPNAPDAPDARTY